MLAAGKIIFKKVLENLKKMNKYSKIIIRAGLQLTGLIYCFGILLNLFGYKIGRYILTTAYADGALEIAPVVLGSAVIMAFIYDIVLKKELF